MKYNYHNTLTTQINALPTRSFYIPFADRNFTCNDFDSPQVTLLTHNLRDMGYDLPDDIITLEECADELMKHLTKRTDAR